MVILVVSGNAMSRKKDWLGNKKILQSLLFLYRTSTIGKFLKIIKSKWWVDLKWVWGVYAAIKTHLSLSRRLAPCQIRHMGHPLGIKTTQVVITIASLQLKFSNLKIQTIFSLLLLNLRWQARKGWVGSTFQKVSVNMQNKKLLHCLWNMKGGGGNHTNSSMWTRRQFFILICCSTASFIQQ